MKTFDMMRLNRRARLHCATTIVELSYWDIFRLLFGREIEFLSHAEMIVLRNGRAYEAFNLEAAPAVEAARPAPDPRD